MAELKLGKKPGYVEDERHFKVSQLLTISEEPLESWRIAVKLDEWPMYANDRYGDCVFASLNGHRVDAQEWSSGQYRREPLRPTVDQILAAYSAVTGFRRDDPSTDNGAYLVDNLKYTRSVGVGLESDGTPHTIYAYARVDLPDSYASAREFRVAARFFGGVYGGLALPASAAGELNSGDSWTSTVDAPYSWGGHAVWIVGYDRSGITCVTWGREQRFSWEWASKYLDEAWVVISEDFINRLGRTPQGLDVDALNRRLSAL